MDMARWTDIQLGLISDIPEIHHAVVKKSHIANTTVPAVSDYYNAGGWFADAEGTQIEHGGDNPNFTCYTVMYPHEYTSITLLTNGNQTNNLAIIENIKAIIDGEANQKHALGIYVILDKIGIALTVVGALSALLFSYLGLRQWKQRSKNAISKRRKLLIAIWIIITFAIITLGIVFPSLAGSMEWKFALEFAYVYSLLTGFVALAFASASITWFVFVHR